MARKFDEVNKLLMNNAFNRRVVSETVAKEGFRIKILQALE